MITWKVVQMHLHPKNEQVTDIVFNVNWKCSASDQGKDAWITGNTEMSFDPTSFVPYEQLTEDKVLNWVWATEDKASIEAQVQTNLDNLINPPIVVKRLPWEPVEKPPLFTQETNYVPVEEPPTTE